MKIDIKKVVKFVTCISVSFMIAFAGLVVPVYAVVTDVDPADYVTGITVVDGIKTVNYEFVDVVPYVSAWADGGGIAENPVGYTYVVSQDANQLALTLCPIGAHVGEGNYCDSGRIIVADILPGCPVDISFSVGVAYYLETGEDNFTYYNGYTAGFYTYDKNGNYLDTVYLRIDESKVTDGSDVIGHIYEISGTIPLNAYAILPWFKFDCWYGDGIVYQVSLTPNNLKMSTAVDSIVEQSHQMGVIQDKLDNILTGTPEQNESAENSAGIVEDQKNQIEDLIDQMTPSKPNTDHIDTDINAIAGADATALFADGMAGILNHPIILAMLSIVAVVSFIGYVLFGKVG